MNLSEIEKIINTLIDTFVKCGDVSLQLRNKGLKKTIKDDNTPVTNGDIMVNNLLIEINDNLSNKEKVKAFMVSLESILDMKEQTVHNLLIKTTTILE